MYLLLWSILLLHSVSLHVCVLHIYNGGALWQSIYRMLIGHMTTIYDSLLMYNSYNVADACKYIYTNYYTLTSSFF